ncbi:ankyrin repeat protein [Volucribacter psittacicida]|uniref:Ankyrin repeat protein n=1 Tax=Volucribacter psittacicida TaxID=203482 RepID=A0A4R1G7B5_9PAST|nr:ankyrin repeat domain-containing protein [Volucribacter psittacicida]TCK01499.1 ankyrin repeat protein [Volucribacter psittacicida]
MNEEKKIKKEDPELLVIDANCRGDISLLKEIFFEKKLLNILAATEVENWNWLHRCNLNPRRAAAIDAVNFYITHGVEVNAQDGAGMTSLHYAMQARNAEAAIALLNAGADPNIPDRDHATALAYISGMPKELALLELMLEKGGNVHFYNGQHGILEGIKKYRYDEPIFLPVIELMEKYA